MRRIFAILLVFVTTSAFAGDAAQIHLALKKLTVLGSAMYVAAHPDDDNAAMIAYLANDRLLRTAYLSMTRGDGGQNLIGDEKGELLGVLRTQELLQSRRIDGGEQYFTRALDFGFSKGPAETLAIWGHDTILGDVVWNIRRFQPDVIITRFPTTGEGGHGHHTASAILAGEAFAAAGDPTKYPEQLKFVDVWQPRRLFWNRFSFRPTDPNDPAVAKSLRVDLGTYNVLLGRSYTELAGESRTQNKSQGTGAPERKGTNINYLDQLAGEPAAKDFMEGIDTTWGRVQGGAAVGAILQQAYDTFDPKDPSKSLPLLLQAHDALQRLGATFPTMRIPPSLGKKQMDLLDAIQMCAGLVIDVSAGDSSIVRDGQVPVSVTVINRSNYPFKLDMVAGKYANPGKGMNTELKNNEAVKTDINLKVPSYTDISQPYWLTKATAGGAYTIDNPQLVGWAQNPPTIPIYVTISDNQFHNLVFSVPAVYRWVDPVRGEQTRSLDVVPDVTANLGSHVYVFPDTQPKPVTVWLQNFGPASSATLRLNVPQGWKAEPASVPLVFSRKGDEAHATFNVTPTAAEGSGVISAEVELPTHAKWQLGLTTIDYPHISPQRVFGDAAAKAVRVNVKKRGSRIGYIMGSGDDVAEALRQIGYEVTLLTDADLERGDFAKYDAIVTGVRAYNTRKRMRLVQPRLLGYVKNGGTLVVQYNTLQELQIEGPGPYPFKVSNDRVTVEEAPVKFVRADHPVLTAPNKITEADFSGWVQERGLNFTQNWDPKYETVLASNDPGEPEKQGGELYARYGKGVFVYTSYAWFRQLPAGVPGAYRLFANLVSAK
jgi:LmbE family N-acetylglucosaminyl deacetylase